MKSFEAYLKQYVSKNQRRGGGRTYVIADRSRHVAGYYTLAVESVEHADAPSVIKKGLGKYPIPVIILARLAADKRYLASFSDKLSCEIRISFEYRRI